MDDSDGEPIPDSELEAERYLVARLQPELKQKTGSAISSVSLRFRIILVPRWRRPPRSESPR